MRIPKIFDCSGDARGTPVLRRPNIAKRRPTAGHIHADAQFQITVDCNGARRTTDLPFTDSAIAHLAVAAGVRNLGMGQLLTEALVTAIKKNMFELILREPSQAPTHQRLSEKVETATDPAKDPLSP